MVAFLIQLLLAIRSWFARRARLETENLSLRQQLVVLRRKSPKRVRLWNIDRLLFVWSYRLYPSLLNAIIIVQPETVMDRNPSVHINMRRPDASIRAAISAGGPLICSTFPSDAGERSSSRLLSTTTLLRARNASRRNSAPSHRSRAR